MVGWLAEDRVLVRAGAVREEEKKGEGLEEFVRGRVMEAEQ